MEIDGVALEQILKDVNQRLSNFAQIQKNGLLNSDLTYAYWQYSQQKLYLDALQLTEEKRRLLTYIIGWMQMSVCQPHKQGTVFISTILNNFLWLAELHKQVNSAKTMEELAEIGQELAKFKQEHPELDNN